MCPSRSSAFMIAVSAAVVLLAADANAQPTSMPQATDGVTRLTLGIFDTNNDRILSDSEREAALERCGSIGDPDTEGSAGLTDDEQRQLTEACMGL